MSSESSSTAGFIEVIVVLGILFSQAIVAIVILIQILKRRRRNDVNAKHDKLLQLCDKDLDDVNAKHDKLLQLCDKDLDKLRSPSNDQQRSLATRGDSDYEMNDVGTNHQFGIDLDRILELQELRDAALCKICFANKTSVFFMPYNHVATCDECSTPLHICPVCRAKIKERKRICFDSDE